MKSCVRALYSESDLVDNGIDEVGGYGLEKHDFRGFCRLVLLAIGRGA